MLCILCELVIAACTLVFLFSLQQATYDGREGAVEHTRREMALGFLSLAFTAAVLLVMVIGTEKLTRVTRTVWTRVNASHVNTALVQTGMEGAQEADTFVAFIAPVTNKEPSC